MSRCSTCRTRADRAGCPGQSWYSWSDIGFCREQMLWLVENLAGLRKGSYPPRPDPTGYIERPGIGTNAISAHARFERPCQLAAEVDARLERTGKDGDVLCHEVIVLQARAYGLLSGSARSALSYISGWRRKRGSYAKWCYERKRPERGPS